MIRFLLLSLLLLSGNAGAQTFTESLNLFKGSATATGHPQNATQASQDNNNMDRVDSVLPLGDVLDCPGVSVGDVVFVNASGEYVACNAAAPATALSVGIVFETIAGSPTRCRVQTAGRVDGLADDTASVLVAGTKYFCSDTLAGGLDSTEPTNSVLIGTASDTDTLMMAGGGGGGALDLSAVDQDYIPDGDLTRDIASDAARIQEMFTGYLNLENTAKTASFTAGGEDSQIYPVSTAAGDVTATLPAVSGLKGRRYTFKHVISGGTLTIDADGTETIDGQLTREVAFLSAVTLFCDGVEWFVESDAVDVAQGRNLVRVESFEPTDSEPTNGTFVVIELGQDGAPSNAIGAVVSWVMVSSGTAASGLAQRDTDDTAYDVGGVSAVSGDRSADTFIAWFSPGTQQFELAFSSGTPALTTSRLRVQAFIIEASFGATIQNVVILDEPDPIADWIAITQTAFTDVDVSDDGVPVGASAVKVKYFYSSPGANPELRVRKNGSATASARLQGVELLKTAANADFGWNEFWVPVDSDGIFEALFTSSGISATNNLAFVVGYSLLTQSSAEIVRVDYAPVTDELADTDITYQVVDFTKDGCAIGDRFAQVQFFSTCSVAQVITTLRCRPGDKSDDIAPYNMFVTPAITNISGQVRIPLDQADGTADCKWNSDPCSGTYTSDWRLIACER